MNFASPMNAAARLLIPITNSVLTLTLTAIDSAKQPHSN